MQSNSSMRTPLGKVRGLGSAKSGTGHFWLQRVTAVANVILAVAFIAIVLQLIGDPYEAAIAKLRNPLVSLLILLFVISALIHMRLGMQTVIEDYLHDEGAKIAAVIGNTFFTILVGGAAVIAILKIALGG
jgi:succinate dehydrogenase / fumarate reductase membrane anchor subunit